ncbi:MAG TPA: cation diffusion facilitator family transporter [Vicinamibacterales bacterium]|nr:cation diffusion facilitator family transporter [Vicinamibacterales bacterium]
MADGARPSLLTNPPSRHQTVARVLARVLILNLAVAAAKLLLGYATGAVSVVSDGFHSLTDSTSNIIGLIGLRAARKPPDADHPYGHRKFETLAAAGIFIFLILAVLEIGRAALHRFASPTPPGISWISFAVMSATLLVNLWVVRYEGGESRRLNSELLRADSVHTRSDVFATIGVLVSLTAVAFGYPILDPIGGLAIAILIGRTSYEIARDTSGILSDRVVIGEDDIRRAVMGIPEVLGCHHIRTRGSMDYVFLDLHVWFPAAMPLVTAHWLSHNVKDRLMEQFPQIADAIIHIEPPPADNPMHRD